MVAIADVLKDLAAESSSLDELVSVLDRTGWGTRTPATGWTIAHQIGHLAWTDEQSRLAATDPDAFAKHMELSFASGVTVDSAAADWAERPPATLLADWRHGRNQLLRALEEVPDAVKLPWFGPPMSPTSMATARIMETWAHGQDVADALGVQRAATDRLRHVAHIAVRVRNYAFSIHGLALPEEEFRITLTGPGGDVWTWGAEDAQQSVVGSALDFCLLATQRRNRADTHLVAQGGEAEQWLEIIQAFAGPPGEGRPAAAAASAAAVDATE